MESRWIYGRLAFKAFDDEESELGVAGTEAIGVGGDFLRRHLSVLGYWDWCVSELSVLWLRRGSGVLWYKSVRTKRSPEAGKEKYTYGPRSDGSLKHQMTSSSFESIVTPTPSI